MKFEADVRICTATPPLNVRKNAAPRNFAWLKMVGLPGISGRHDTVMWAARFGRQAYESSR
jgi:hypothetical protein